MERYQKIIQNKIFQREYQRLKKKERDRRFCCHDMEHFLAVARICYIIVLEKKLEISKDIIYGTAFLHDLGRMEEYENGKSHEEAGADLAEEILPECGYEPWEISLITDTIRGHRREGQSDPESFSDIFYDADKLSRDCIHCSAKKECYWPEDKKKQQIQILGDHI